MFSSLIYRSSPLWLQEELIAWRSQLRNRLREGRRFRERLREARETQWYTCDQLLRLQASTLRQLLRHASERVPYYRELFARVGVAAADADYDALAKLPVLEKRGVLEQGKKMLAQDYGAPRITINTSGSTGTPLRILQDMNAVVRENAFLWRQLEWAGFKRGQRRAWIRGDMVVPIEQQQPPYWRLNRADDMLMLSSYHLGEGNAGGYLQALEDFNPSVIQAYPSSIAYLARFSLARGRAYRGRLRAVITSSETLNDADRALIEAQFGCRVFDQYGNGERVALIQTCEQGIRHLATDYSIVELFPLGEGLYEMVGTGFNNWVMPFIRYRTGDTVRLGASQCACGRAFPVVEAIGGRMDEYVSTPDGRRIGRLDHIFKDTHHIAEGQIVQNRIDEIVVRIVPLGEFTPADMAALKANAHARLGREVDVKVEIVPAIPRGSNGKFRAVVSAV